MRPQSERGSALLVALIVASVLLTAVAALYNTAYTEMRSTMRVHLRNAAFYLAEAGVERATQLIAAGTYEVAAGQSNYADSLFVVLSEDNVALTRERVGQIRVVIQRDPAAGRYTVSSLGVARHPDGLAVLQSVRAEYSLEGKVGAGFAIKAVDSIRFGFSNGSGVRVASYDSAKNFGAPDWTYNFGYDAAVGVASSVNNRLDLNNAYVRGTLRTGGGNPRIDSNSDPSRASRLEGPDTPAGVLFDPNRVAKDFSDPFPAPAVPTLDDSWNKIIVGQNDNSYRNVNNLTLGSSGQKTYLKLPYGFDTRNNSVLTVAGEVILHLERNMNLSGTLRIQAGASLTIYVAENAHINIECGDWPPDLFRINATGTATVQVNNTDVFTGVINAPRSDVRLNGSNKIPRMQVRGAVIAKELTTTNQMDIFFDVNLPEVAAGGGGGGGGGSPEISMISWRPVRAREVEALLPPSSRP